MKARLVNILVFPMLLFLFSGCGPEYTPKPRAYFRIDLPAKEYQMLAGVFPYRFDYPTYASINLYNGQWLGTDTAEYWINVEFPRFNSRIHLTYKPVRNNLNALIDDSHAYAYKHSVKADAIVQSEYVDTRAGIYSVLFDIKGNTASSMQFYATDSVRHFLRGALYFDCEPNKDSLAPVKDFLRADILKMIETLTWVNNPSK